MATPSNTAAQPPTGTRERLVDAMLHALRHKGYHGVGLNELLSAAQAPKGVLYHHFPGGKAELAVAAIEAVIAQINEGLDRLFTRYPDPAQALQAWMGGAQKILASSGFASGCPLATIALESAPQDTAIREALARGFAALRQRLGKGLHRAGMEAARADSLAALIVSAYEGALVQARVAGDVEVMHSTCRALVDLVVQSLPPPKSATPKEQP